MLAISRAQRSELIPDAPTIAESGYPSYSVLPWASVLAATKTAAIIAGIKRVFI